MLPMQCYFLIFFTKDYVVDTCLNCLDKSRQFKQVPTTFAEEVDKSTLRLLNCLTVR